MFALNYDYHFPLTIGTFMQTYIEISSSIFPYFSDDTNHHSD